MSAADRLLANLDGVRQTGPGRWLARCPAHDDRRPSLSIREGDDGRVLVNCFSACPTADVLAALRLSFSDLFELQPHGAEPRADRIRVAKPTGAEVLQILDDEAIMLSVALAMLDAGEPFTAEDRERIRRGLARVDMVREAFSNG